MRYTIENLCQSVSQLKAGSRAWYALLPESYKNQEPPLILFPLSEEDIQEKIQHALAMRTPEEQEILRFGTAVVNIDGIINLKEQNFSPLDLFHFSEWLTNHADSHPILNRLKYLALEIVDDQGQGIRKLASNDLYSFVDDAPIPGGMFETGHRLRHMEDNVPHWFWMSKDGPQNKPILLIQAKNSDPNGDALLAEVQRLQLRAGRLLQGISGIVMAVSDGSLSFAAFNKPSDWKDIINALLDEYQNKWLGFRRLAKSQMHRIVDGELKSRSKKAKPKRDLKNQVKGLKRILDEHVLTFWLTDNDGLGQPLLLLHPDGQKLKEEAKSVKHQGQAVNGKVRISSKGYIEFRSKKGFSNFVGTLALWVRSNIKSYPDLAGFRGSRFIQAGDDKQILDRQKDDSAWTGLI